MLNFKLMFTAKGYEDSDISIVEATSTHGTNYIVFVNCEPIAHFYDYEKAEAYFHMIW